MNDDIKKVIAESVDTALSLFDYVDKERFYHTFETKYGIKIEDIPVNYESFHTLLSDTFGVKHYAIERTIIKTLHERTKIGIYDKALEIPAFTILVESYMTEVKQTVVKSKSQIDKNTKSLEKIKRTQA